ncbi:MAG: hypothetical protein OXI44_10040 [Bacteroidota bacterium]|nr:hypothetical protein [Bacteroidota bacterium]
MVKPTSLQGSFLTCLASYCTALALLAAALEKLDKTKVSIRILLLPEVAAASVYRKPNFDLTAH